MRVYCLFFMILFVLGGCSLASKDTRFPASLNPARQGDELIAEIKDRFQGQDSFIHLKGTTTLEGKNKSNHTVKCDVEFRAGDESYEELGTYYLRITGAFPRHWRKHSDRFWLGASAGDNHKFSIEPIINYNRIEFETVRNSDWGGRVKERVIITGRASEKNLTVRFITSPLTLGFSLPFDRTDMTCSNVGQITQK